MAIKIQPKLPIVCRQIVSEQIPANSASTEAVAGIPCHQLL